MNVPLLGRALGRTIDERFLTHRLRSTSIAGIIGGVTAILLFAYRFYVNHLWSWDLFAVALTIVVVKLAAMTWYHFTD
jgi:hypothetical protein